MEIIFTRSENRRDKTRVSRRDGVTLSIPVLGPLEPVPHDLAHYVIERELNLQEGFWATVAAGGVFEGMRIVAGRQRPHAQERSRALMKVHHHGIIFAEVVVEAVIRSVNGEPPEVGPLPVDFPGVPMRTTADRASLIARLRPPMEEMRARWRAIPLGDTLSVSWQDASPRQTFESLAHILARPYRGNIRPLSHR